MSISGRVGRESSLAEPAVATRQDEDQPDDHEAELIREARALMAAGRF